ncbi:MAG: zinc-binding dehydrogenase [Verrucomicrobiota bacterium]|nr:zinc-binding dehydrogenase [Verrucomicrobiota bacterium]
MEKFSHRMKAAVLVSPAKVEIAEVAIPEPGPTGVRVRLHGCGVCGSNLPLWEGRPWFKYPNTPGNPGHEGWGEVDAVGDQVSQFRKGERVALLSYNAFAEYDVADQEAVVPLPGSLNGNVFPGEALGCAVNVFRRSNIQAGQTVAIIGIGFLGALLVGLAANAGATVIAISRRPFSLETASQFGAEFLIPMDDHQQIIGKVMEITKGAGCDRVIEAVGLQWPLDLAAELTRERGRLIIAGYHQDGPRQVNMQLWNWRGLDVINAHERESKMYVEGMRSAVELVASGRLDPAPLYTHRFDLGNISNALNTMKERPETFLKGWVAL